MSDNKENIKEKTKYKVSEDETKYGEFVSSYFSWIPLEKQKNIANKLENITKDKK